MFSNLKLAMASKFSATKIGKCSNNNSVVIAFYTKPYHRYSGVEHDEISLLGIICNWNSTFGFAEYDVVGTKPLFNTVIELCENITNGFVSHNNITHLYTHRVGSNNRHLYSCRIEPSVLYDIQRKSVSVSPDRILENAGYNIVHIGADSNILKLPYSNTSKKEITILLQNIA